MNAPLPITLGSSPYNPPAGDVGWETVELDGESYVRVANVDAMPPFFMSIVSDSDPWLFVGSQAAFTYGRVQPDGALFPYQTVDRILAHPDSSGARSVLLVRRGESWALWEPWQPSGRCYSIRRDLYKHVHGTSVIFEETNHDLQLRFCCELSTCEPYGLVRECRLENLGDAPVDVRYLDGFHQMIPPGLDVATYTQLSYLATAYMRHDKVPGLPLGVYTLNAKISDRAEPAESLRAAVGWSLGHANPTLLLSDRQIDRFRSGHGVEPDTEVRAALGACLVADEVTLAPQSTHQWIHVADTNLDHAAVVRLRDELADPETVAANLRTALAENRTRLRRRIAAADGLQQSADSQVCVHHFANVMFNCMRGGTFPDGNQFPAPDFAAFVRTRSIAVFAGHQDWLEALAGTVSLDELHHRLAERNDPQLLRLASEYLPLTFSRRHGDPSRPWNQFAIRLRDEQGNPIYTYEGNWRDIFQNWEGLSLSFPSWLPPMINVFLSASTADGYNPYRVTREGIDWEVLEPDDPWGHIGYWGDHQIIYLLRLLEADGRYHPGRLAAELARRAYTYAEVPYEIDGFDALVADPRESIAFNHELHEFLTARAAEQGGDGKLLQSADGEIALVTLAEKLLVPLLAKLSNLVPDGGIWLNTQRPEWNDANNALAGWGLSMVTVYYIRRYLRFCTDLFAQADTAEILLSTPVVQMMDAVKTALADRNMEALGRAGESYRAEVYRRTPFATEPVAVERIQALFTAALSETDRTIQNNRRPDGLYHSYNTLELDQGTVKVHHLPLMLEGQVAVLSAGCLSSTDVVAMLKALRNSDLYRADQQSYMLYADRDLPTFLERNTFASAPLDDPSLFVRDAKGDVHFQADLSNARDVEERLDRLGVKGTDRAAVLALWESVFQHRSFTGRSSTFFAFEGLGSIYWHMVAKLLLAVQECQRDADAASASALADAYDDVRRGLGFTKTPDVFGAIPSDPYSHSPSHCGAQQPGMTGQVKEEVLTRWGELGVETQDGSLRFAPRLLHRHEFSEQPTSFAYVDVQGAEQTLELPANALAFTVCQVPVCYRLGDSAILTVHRRDDKVDEVAGSELGADDSAHVFARDGSIVRLDVDVSRESLRL